MDADADIEFVYEMIVKASSQGLVFGEPTFEYKGQQLPFLFDTLTFKQLENRADTLEGATALEQATKDEERRLHALTEQKTASDESARIVETELRDQFEQISMSYDIRYKTSSTEPIEPITNDNAVNGSLPKTFPKIWFTRYKDLIGAYVTLKNSISNTHNRLYDTSDGNNIYGVDVKHLIELTNNNAESMLFQNYNPNFVFKTASLLFYVAKTFMRIPIVLIASSLRDKILITPNDKNVILTALNTSNLSTVQNNAISVLDHLKQLVSHIYTDEFKRVPAFVSALRSYGVPREVLNFYDTKDAITLDQLCYMFVYYKPNSANAGLNYEYFINVICERMIFVINFWCNTNVAGTQYSKLGFLRKHGYDTLEKIYSQNDSLVTFVKIRAGGVVAGMNGKWANNGLTSAATMNVRYGNNVNTLIINDRVLHFTYDDNVNSFYEPDIDVGMVVLGTDLNSRETQKIISDKTLNKVVKFKRNNETPNPKNEYYLGPFDKIFDNKKIPTNIANDPVFIQKILEPLIEGKCVSIIGYGASGSGKTSVLIKLKTPDGLINEPGVLMEIANKLGVDGFLECSLRIVEYGTKFSGTTPSEYLQENALVGQYEYNLTEKDKNNKWTNTKKNVIVSTKSEQKLVFNYTSSMFDNIMYFIEDARDTAKTPNNPVSSRSHVIIILKFKKDDIIATLFICDFAGVENSFQGCDQLKDGDEVATSKFGFNVKAPSPYLKPIQDTRSTDELTDLGEQANVALTAALAAQGKAVDTSIATSFAAQSKAVDTSILSSRGAVSGAVSTPQSNITTFGESKPADELADGTDVRLENFKQGLEGAIMEPLRKYIAENQNFNTQINSTLTQINTEDAFYLKHQKYALGKYFQEVKTHLLESYTNDDAPYQDALPKLNTLMADFNAIPTNFSFVIPTVVLTAATTNISFDPNNVKPITVSTETNVQYPKGTYVNDKAYVNTLLVKIRYKLQNGMVNGKKHFGADGIGTDKPIANGWNTKQLYDEKIAASKSLIKEALLEDSKIKKFFTSKTNNVDIDVIIDIIISHMYYTTGSAGSRIWKRYAWDSVKELISTAISKYDFATKLATHNVSNTMYQITPSSDPNNKSSDINVDINGNHMKITITKVQFPNPNFDDNIFEPSADNQTKKLGSAKFEDGSVRNEIITQIGKYRQTETVINKVVIEYNKQLYTESSIPISIPINEYTLDLNSLKPDIEQKICNEINNFLKVPGRVKLFTQLYILKHVGADPPKSNELCLFIFYLRINNKILGGFKPDYEAFQFKILIEQLIFKYDEKDDTLDNDKMTGGYLQKGGVSHLAVFCNNRTKEGVRINQSLKDLRMDIMQAALSNKGSPPFISQCLPIQCNPEFKECMGIKQYFSESNSSQIEEEGALLRLMKKYSKPNPIDENETPRPIIFCVFCVFNVSEPHYVEEPPPIPYLDVSKLEQIYQVLENLGIEDFRDPDAILKETVVILEEIMGKDDELLKVGTTAQTTFEKLAIKIPELAKLKKNQKNIVRATTDTSLVRTIIIQQTIQNLKYIIDQISTANAATPIGTLLFTDAMSKLFLDVNTCNLGASRVPPNFDFKHIIGRGMAGGANAIANKSSKKRTQKIRK